MKGFQYIEDKQFPMITIKLDGKSISVEQLVKIAEQMRIELLVHGVDVELVDKKNG